MATSVVSLHASDDASEEIELSDLGLVVPSVPGAEDGVLTASNKGSNNRYARIKRDNIYIRLTH
jgi:hypothetical protein